MRSGTLSSKTPVPKSCGSGGSEAACPLKKFFNTSGLQYKALGLKDKLSAMSEEEQLELLSTDGMLVKRPLLIGEDFVRVGFRQPEWEETLG